MLVRILGTVEVVDETSGTALDLGRRRQREVLALLAARPGEVVSEDALVDQLWPDPDDLPENPRRSLQTYVSRLRSAMGTETVTTEPPGYRLQLETDASRFEVAVGRARTNGDITALQASLAAWRGEPYGEFAGHHWVAGHAEHLRSVRAVAIEDLGELLIAANDPGAAATHLSA